MRASGMIARATAAAVIAVTIPVAGGAQQTLKIFDAHLHYNQQVRSSDLFGRANKIRGLC
jgi:hypothetical protein